MWFRTAVSQNCKESNVFPGFDKSIVTQIVATSSILLAAKGAFKRLWSCRPPPSSYVFTRV